MVNGLSFFDEAARVGEMILDVLGDQGPGDEVATYFERCGKIYHLMVDVHDEVADIAIRVGLAQDVEEAKHALSRLDNNRLADVFRARDWCDEFEWLGGRLAPLAEKLNLDEQDQAIWSEFCSSLAAREGEVAFLYEAKLYDLRSLQYGDMALGEIKHDVDEVCGQLVLQKAKFDLLAKRADSMRRRMR